MRLGAIRVSFTFFHSRGLNLIAVALVPLAAYECAALIVNQDLHTLYYGALAAGGIVAVVAMLKDWRVGLYSLFAWIMVDDLVRKYLGNNMLIYFAKDFLFLTLCLSFLLACRTTGKRLYKPPFLVTLLVFFSYCFVEVFNPASTSLFYGLMGLKLCFLYVPLLVVGHALVNSEEQLRRFFFFNSILILFVTEC